MKIAKCLLAGALALVTMPMFSQMGEYKDPYKASQNGTAMAPAAALDSLLGMFEYEAVKAAEAMPADKYNFAPSGAKFAEGSTVKFEGVRTFAGQVAHLAQANFYFFGTLNGAKPPVDVKAIGAMRSKEELVAALKQSFAFGHAQIATITAANAFVGIEGADGMHTRATVAAFAVAHGYDHYGQMVEYLRMNGIVPDGSK